MGCSTLRHVSEHDMFLRQKQIPLLSLSLWWTTASASTALHLPFCTTTATPSVVTPTLFFDSVPRETRLLNLTLLYSPLTVTHGGKGVTAEEGLHIKQCVTLILHLSMAAVMEASSNRKPSSAKKSPIQLTLFHRTVLKCQPPAAQQTSYLLKILFDMWGNLTFKRQQFNFEYFIAVFLINNTFVCIPKSFTISILKAK